MPACFLISPFAQGRILRTLVQAARRQDFQGHDDPGVAVIARILRLLQAASSIATAVIAAPDSSRQYRQIESL